MNIQIIHFNTDLNDGLGCWRLGIVEPTHTPQLSTSPGVVMLLDLQGLLGHSLTHCWTMGTDSCESINELSQAMQVFLHQRFFMSQLLESSLQSSHWLIHTVLNLRFMDELTIHSDKTLNLLQVQPENTMDVGSTPGNRIS